MPSDGAHVGQQANAPRSAPTPGNQSSTVPVAAAELVEQFVDPAVQCVGELELGERAAAKSNSRHRRSEFDARSRLNGADNVTAGNTRGRRRPRRRPARGRSPRCGRCRGDGRRQQQQFAGAERTLGLVDDREQAAEPLQERPDRCDVGTSDEPHRAPHRIADRSAANRVPTPSCGRRRRSGAPPRRGRCSVPPTATSQRRRLAAKARATACESHPQSSTSPPDQSRACAPCRRLSRRRPGQVQSPPPRSSDRVGHQATCRLAGVWMMLGQR